MSFKASAAVIEEEYKEQQKEKERVLKRFQEEVKHRVNQHVKQRKKQQLQKSYEAVSQHFIISRSIFLYCTFMAFP